MGDNKNSLANSIAMEVASSVAMAESAKQNTGGTYLLPPIDALALQKYGVPKQYISAFMANLNAELKKGVYDGSKYVNARKLQSAFELAAGETVTAPNSPNLILDPIKSHFGITKDTSSNTTGWGRMVVGLNSVGGAWYVATGPGSVDPVVAKLIPTAAPGGPKTAGLGPAGETGIKATRQDSAYNTVYAALDQWGMLPAKPNRGDYGAGPAGEASYNAALRTWQADDSVAREVYKLTHQAASIVDPKVILDYVRSTSAYKTAFPGLTERNLGRDIATHMTEQDYQNFVTSTRGLMQQYGMPELTRDQIASLIKNDVSTTEFTDRVIKGYAAAANADPATKAQLARFGINTSDLAHYYLDPKNALPALERKTAAATLAGYAQEVGLRGVSDAGFMQLADRVNLGAGSPYGTQSMASVQQALQTASRDASLTSAGMPGSGAQTTSMENIIGAQIAGFGGTTQTSAQAAVARAEQSRVAPFEKGGGYTESGRGVAGLGSART